MKFQLTLNNTNLSHLKKSFKDIKGFIYLNLKAYAFLIFLTGLVFLRLSVYKFPPAKDLNYQGRHLITSNYIIENEKFIFKSNDLKIVTYILPLKDSYTTTLLPGDVVLVSGKRYYKTIYAKDIKYLNSTPLSYLYKTKNHLLNFSYVLLPQPHATLLNGMLFGTEPIIADSFKESLIKSGLIHVVVVSGFNVSLVMGLAYSLFKYASLNKRFIFGSTFALLYLFIVGFEPPILRAVLMGILVAFSQARGEDKNSIYILLVIVLLMLLFQPTLIDSLSLHLTFLATLGIYLLGMPLDRYISSSSFFNFLPSFIKTDVSASFSAQLFVTPLLIYKFERISLISLPANFLILWTIPLIMFIGFLYLLLSSLYLLPLTYYLSFILQAPLEVFIDFVNFMSSLPYSNVSLTISPPILFLLYFILLLLVLFIRSKLWKKENY